MPITPKQIKERRQRVEFTFGGEPVWVEYTAAPVEALTKEQIETWQEQLNAVETVEEANLLIARWICEYVTAWDVYEDAPMEDYGFSGDMIPLTPERVAELDSTFLARVFFEVVRDANQSKLGGMAS